MSFLHRQIPFPPPFCRLIQQDIPLLLILHLRLGSSFTHFLYDVCIYPDKMPEVVFFVVESINNDV